MATQPIAIVGVSGGVGQATLHQLRQWQLAPLRLGFRDTGSALATALAEDRQSIHPVDCYQLESVAKFIDGARLVVNCAGPYSRLGLQVVDAAIAAGVDVVDVNGGQQDRLALRSRLPLAMTVVLGCGMMPGLTGALPIWASRRQQRVSALRLLVGGRDYLTPAGAADIIHAARQRALQGDALVTTRSIPPNITELFLDDAEVFPYEDDELVFLSVQLGTEAIEAWAVYAGKATQAMLVRALRHDADLDEMAQSVARVSRADVAGLPRYQQLVVDLFGVQKEEPETRVSLRALGASELTGAVLATVTRGLIDGRVSPGGYLGCEVLAQEWAMDWLQGCNAVIQFGLSDVREQAPCQVEEGIL